jgi:hypothetical protein
VCGGQQGRAGSKRWAPGRAAERRLRANDTSQTRVVQLGSAAQSKPVLRGWELTSTSGVKGTPLSYILPRHHTTFDSSWGPNWRSMLSVHHTSALSSSGCIAGVGRGARGQRGLAVAGQRDRAGRIAGLYALHLRPLYSQHCGPAQSVANSPRASSPCAPGHAECWRRSAGQRCLHTARQAGCGSQQSPMMRTQQDAC